LPEQAYLFLLKLTEITGHKSKTERVISGWSDG